MSTTYRANQKQNSDHGIWEGYEDFRFPAHGINNGGSASPSFDELSGRLLFSANSVEYAAGIAQMPHTWKEGTDIYPHLHWSKTTSETGLVLWGLQWRKAKPGAVFGAWSSIDYAESVVVDSNVAEQHAIAKFSPIVMSGDLLSTIVNLRFGRVGTSVNSDTYGENAALWELDFHYRIDARGSREEFFK